LHFSFLFCGVEAFTIVLRYNEAASLQLPSKVDNELNGLNRLMHKVVKRVLEDRDWRADILDVLRQAQRVTIIVFYMLKSCPPTSEVNQKSTEDVEKKEIGQNGTNSFMDAYLKGRVDRLVKQLDDISSAAKNSSNFMIKCLGEQADELRLEMLAFSKGR